MLFDVRAKRCLFYPCILLATLLAAFARGSQNSPQADVQLSISVVKGDKQAPHVNEKIHDAICVQVSDESGRPVPFATVTFVLTPPGGGAGALSSTSPLKLVPLKFQNPRMSMVLLRPTRSKQMEFPDVMTFKLRRHSQKKRTRFVFQKRIAPNGSKKENPHGSSLERSLRSWSLFSCSGRHPRPLRRFPR